MEHGQLSVILLQENAVSRVKFESSNFVAKQKRYLPISCVVKQISRGCDLSTYLKKVEVGRIERKYLAFKALIWESVWACVSILTAL